MQTAIQWIETAATEEQAEACLEGMRGQDGFLGGWVLPANEITPAWRAQGFMDATGVDPRGWLPDGLRFVHLPASITRKLGR
jgi:hypothetical protein